MKKMNTLFSRHAFITPLCLGFALLAGCNTTKTLYGWEEYQPEVYEYFEGADTNEQIIVLEKNLEQFKAHDQLAPPGFHAHLGLLYINVGDLNRGAQEFGTEKRLFPESTPFMDFLLSKKGQRSPTASNTGKASANQSDQKSRASKTQPLNGGK